MRDEEREIKNEQTLREIKTDMRSHCSSTTTIWFLFFNLKIPSLKVLSCAYFMNEVWFKADTSKFA